MNRIFRLSIQRRPTYSTVAARSRSLLTSAHGSCSLVYSLTSEASLIASASPARKRTASICSPTASKPASTASISSRSRAVSSPGSGTAPKLRNVLVSVRLTRLPQVATSSSLFLRTNSAQVKSVSWVSGPAAIR